MRVAALSPTSVLGTWGFALLERVLETCCGPVRTALLDAASAIPEPGGPDGIELLLAHYPGPSFIDLIADPGLPVVAFVEDPLATVQYVRKASGSSNIEAIRVVSASLAAIATAGWRRPILVVRRGHDATDVREVLIRIAEYLYGFTGRDVFATFAARVDGLGPDAIPLETALARFVPGYEPLDTASADLTLDDANVAELCLGGLARAAAGQALNVTWPRSTFLLGDRPSEQAVPVTDLAGAARILYYGPYLHLPAGRMKVRATVGFSASAARTVFAIAVWNPEILGEARVVPRSGGVFAAEFEVVVREPHRALELTVRTEQGSIEGKVGLVQAEFSALLPQANEARDAAQALAG